MSHLGAMVTIIKHLTLAALAVTVLPTLLFAVGSHFLFSGTSKDMNLKNV